MVGAVLLRETARVPVRLPAGVRVQYELKDFRYAYLAPARGAVEVNGFRLAVGDGIAARDEPRLTVSAEEDSEVILVVTA